MLYPSIDELLDKANSKYALVVLAAKRARQLLEGAQPCIAPKSAKHVGTALEEISQDVLSVDSL